MTNLYTIKPLEWEWFEFVGARTQGYRAQAGERVYVVYRFNAGISGGEALWTGWRWGITTRQMHDCASPEEGKQLAEEHWQAYIQQGLVRVNGELK
ncbi:MAG TPA: hypothetical protein VJS64_09425 [Pyrinomonadaceae bacterium]|nr:hypothetical protein [Pyrinomonadaceae bacterium]